MDYRYHCTIPAGNGHNTLPFNPCQLLDFTLLRLEAGQSWSGESGDREILAVVLGGTASFTVGAEKFPAVGGRADVFSGKPHSVYIPAGSTVTIEAAGPVEIAMPSAPSDLADRPVRHRAEPGRRRALGRGQLRPELPPDPHRDRPAGPARPAAHRRRDVHPVRATGARTRRTGTRPTTCRPRPRTRRCTTSGSTPRGGFGICRMYTDEGYEENFTARDHGMQMMPEGYHTVVSAPGYTTYYLWALAGTQRTQGAHEDTDLAWVGKSVPVLRDLGL